jgi:hypothetical protein
VEKSGELRILQEGICHLGLVSSFFGVLMESCRIADFIYVDFC